MIVVLNTYTTIMGIILINCDYFVILFNELQLTKLSAFVFQVSPKPTSKRVIPGDLGMMDKYTESKIGYSGLDGNGRNVCRFTG